MAVNVAGLIAVLLFYIVIFIAGIVAAKIKSKKNENNGREDEEVMLAGRNLGWFVGCFTMTATWVGGGYINGTAELVYKSGLVWAQAPWGYALSLTVGEHLINGPRCGDSLEIVCKGVQPKLEMARAKAPGGLFFAKIMRHRRYVTMLDPLQEKYGNWMGGILYIPAFLGETMWSAAILGALGSTLSIIIDLEIDLAVVISAIIAVGYTFFGGLYSVAYTDVIQLICIFLGLWLTIPFAMKHKDVAPIKTTSKQWLGTFEVMKTGEWMDYAMHLICGGLPWQVYFQRVLSAKKTSYAKGLSFFASFGAMFMAIPAVLIGAIAASTNWADVNLPRGMLNSDNKTLTDTRLVLPLVLQYLTPQWVSIFGMGAISAAVMSSADSSILSASSMFAHNIYKLLIRPKASEKELIWVVRVGIVGVGAVATLMALTIKSVYYLFVLCSDLVFVLLFPQLVCALYVPHANLYGSFFGFFVGLFFRIGGGEHLIKLAPIIVYPLYQEKELKQLFPYRTLSMLLSLITLIGLSYLTHFLFVKKEISKKYDFFHVFAEKENKDIELKNGHRNDGERNGGFENQERI